MWSEKEEKVALPGLWPEQVGKNRWFYREEADEVEEAGNGKFCLGSVGYWTSKNRSSVDGCINESWSSREKLGLQTHMGRHQLIVCIESHRTGCRKYYCILLENRTKVKKKEW